MTSNKTYHFQTTANHHRFIKEWTSIDDLPTSNFFVKTFLSCGATSINTLVCHRFCVCVTDFWHDDWTSSNTRSTTSCPSIVLVFETPPQNRTKMFFFAKLSLKSTQFYLRLRQRLALFSDTSSHPPVQNCCERTLNPISPGVLDPGKTPTTHPD